MKGLSTVEINTTETLTTLLNDYVLVKKVDLEQLILQSNSNMAWVDFNTVEKMTGLSRSKLDTIMKRYRHELDIEYNGPVKYPDGGRWSFEREGILSWLKENHSRIWKDDIKLS